MATKKFSELTVLDTVNANLVLTVIPVYDTSSGTTRKVTLQQINDSIEANIPFAAAAFTQANTPSHVANSASNYANAAFLRANTATTDAANADSKAISSGVYANSAYGVANTANTNSITADSKAVSAGNYANSAYEQANTANTNAATVDGKVVAAGLYANSAFAQANTANTIAQAAYDYANTIVIIDSWARDSVNSSSSYGNSAFAIANTANTLAQAAFDQANTGGGLTASSVATLTNKTYDVSVGSNNIFSIQGQSITSYSGSGQVLILQNSPTISVLNLSDSQLNLDGGTGIYYWSGQSGVAQAGDLKAGVYSSDPSSNNSLFTFGGAGANNMSVSVEGSLFVGTALPSNDGGLNTTFPGWLVVQSGGKFGGDIDTLGGLTLYGNIYSTSACSSINFVANSSGDGFGASTMQLVPDGNLTGTDQYLIIDPTAPGHIHIRAGGTQDDSGAELFLGGENSHVKIGAGLNPPVTIKSNAYSWTFDVNGELTVPGKIYFDNGIESALTLDQFGIRANTQLTLSAENYVTGNNSTILFDKNGSGITFRLEDNTPVSKNWIFNQNKLTFPDSTEQTTAFTANPTVNILKINDGVHEQFQTKADATGTVVHDCSSGHIFYHTSPDANWTVNLTNLNLTSTYATTVTLIIVQGGTGYYPNAVEIAGSAQTINWSGNTTPTPSSNRTDVVTFSILNTGTGYVVFGQLTGF